MINDTTLHNAAPPTTYHRTVTIGDVDLFYREVGPRQAPVVLLLHGFPTSSHMYRNLIPLLAGRFHVIAPDYPGFGQSSAPDHSRFSYSFANFANLVDELLGQLGISKDAIYLMDYGAPVGLRLALKHPDRVAALIIQNGNAYENGLKEVWEPIKDYCADRSAARRQALAGLLTLEATKFQYLDGVRDPTRVDPDSWLHDQTLRDRPGNNDVQLDLFYDYGSNVALDPAFQEFLRRRQPPALILWGANDKIFPADGARAYMRDLPQAGLHFLDTGHFALEDKLDEMAPMIDTLLARHLL